MCNATQSNHAAGWVTKTIDALTKTTQLKYNDVGQMTESIDPLTRTTKFEFDTAGRQTKVIDPLTKTTLFAYNDNGEVTQTIDAGGSTSQTAYDAAGRMTQVIDGTGKTTQHKYNDNGEMTEVVNPLTFTSKFEFDGGGRQTKAIDGLTKTTLFYFDDAGRQTKMVDPVSATTQYQFDARDQMTRLIDPNGNTTAFGYDAAGNKTSQIDPLTRTQTWSYDANNRQTQTIDRNTRTVAWAYDDANYLTSEVHYNAGGTATSTLTYSYNANGKMLTAANGNGTYTLSYDDDGQVTQVLAPFGITLGFAYDAGGQRTLVTDSKGGTTSSTYDDDGRLSRQTFTDGTKNLRMDLTYTASDQVSTQVRYSDLGGTTTVAYSDYDYDDAGQVTSLVHKDASHNTLDSFSDTYNAAGRLTQQVRGTVTSNFGYDDSGQLTSDASSTYGFDAAGNRNTNGFAATTGNRMTTDGTWNYTYDNEGNQTRKDHISTSYYWTYDYGNKNELLQAKYYNAVGTLQKDVQFQYDALDNRLQKTTIAGGTTTTTRFAVDGWNPAKAGSLGASEFDVWADLDANNTLTMRFLRGDAVDEIVAQVGATAYWTLTDRQGSVSDIVNQSGVVKNALTYDGFGRLLAQTDSNFGSRYQWTGREFDVETDLQYNRARYYDPSTGRWISQDPLGFAAGDSNLSRYAKNQPTMATDPSGLQPPIGKGDRENGFKFNPLDFLPLPPSVDNDVGPHSLGMRGYSKYLQAREAQARAANLPSGSLSFESIVDGKNTATVIEKKDLQLWSGRNVKISYTMKFEIPKTAKGPFYLARLIYIENQTGPPGNDFWAYFRSDELQQEQRKGDATPSVAFQLHPGKYKVMAAIAVISVADPKRNREIIPMMNNLVPGKNAAKHKAGYLKFIAALLADELVAFHTWDFEIKK